MPTTRSRLAAAVSPIAFGIALATASSTAWAQEAPATTDPNAPAATTTDQTTTDEAKDEAAAPESAIIVTGFRASLQSAINTKKRADQIVESVSSEDIGKLPETPSAATTFRAEVPQVFVTVDRETAKARGVKLGDLFATLQAMLSA